MRYAFFGIGVFLIFPAAFGQQYDAPCNSIGKDTFVCYVDTVSWVEVTFQGDHLKKHKSSYEKLIRLRLRNDLSMMRQETLEWTDALKKFDEDLIGKEMKRRSSVYCHIWTVGDTDFPVVWNVDCKMFGYGIYESVLYKEISVESLGFSNEQGLKDQIDTVLRSTITNISADLLTAKDSIRTM